MPAAVLSISTVFPARVSSRSSWPKRSAPPVSRLWPLIARATAQVRRTRVTPAIPVSPRGSPGLSSIAWAGNDTCFWRSRDPDRRPWPRSRVPTRGSRVLFCWRFSRPSAAGARVRTATFCGFTPLFAVAPRFSSGSRVGSWPVTSAAVPHAFAVGFCVFCRRPTVSAWVRLLSPLCSRRPGRALSWVEGVAGFSSISHTFLIRSIRLLLLPFRASPFMEAGTVSFRPRSRITFVRRFRTSRPADGRRPGTSLGWRRTLGRFSRHSRSGWRAESRSEAQGQSVLRVCRSGHPGAASRVGPAGCRENQRASVSEAVAPTSGSPAFVRERSFSKSARPIRAPA